MLILAVAMLLGAQAVDVPRDPKAAFKACIKGATLDTYTDIVTACLKKQRDLRSATALPDDGPVDPIAKKVAEDEAEKYSIVVAAEQYDPRALCVQAGLTAQAYLDAKMPRKYDSWKAIERGDCAAADRAARARN